MAASKKNPLRQVGRVSGESVVKHTGKDWDQWIKLLNKAKAGNWTHKEIATYLRKKLRLTIWWAHEVAGGYEIVLGRRVPGRNIKGEYSLTVTKTLPLGVDELWEFLESERGLELWLQPLSPLQIEPGHPFETRDGYYGEVRTLMPRMRARLSWMEAEWKKKSYLQLMVIPRPGKKSILGFYHTGIFEDVVAARLRKRWKQATEKIAEHLRILPK